MKIIIRKAVEQDFPTIISLLNEFAVFQKTPEKVSITLEQMMQEKDFFTCIVAETEHKEIAGFATFFSTYHSWSGKGLYLDDLYVKAAFRKQFIGKKLLEEIITLAKKEDCKEVRWRVSGWNTTAIDFYKKIGAEIDSIDFNCTLSLSKNSI
ncbi:MAG TPA: GNAT family N-acetyltransferase [Ginsengibacter sp.]|nr:GNAT family N-acetyltransferase [Ginsengibacter sp.]